MKRVLSGIQPSGALHLGNYLGAISQWITMQEEHESLFCVVDLHAITVRQDPEALRHNIREVAASYIAAGVDPSKASVFVQSAVPQHAELAWVLSTFTQMGELERMTQYKDKSQRMATAEGIGVGLFTYPTLMAADILLYQTDVVPVGDDQKQHVELTRNIAQRLNNTYNEDIFTLPEPQFPTHGARIMALDDASSKMSKSAGSKWSFISFTDTPDEIRKKIMRAATDSEMEVRAGEDKPELTNLLNIYSVLAGIPVAALESQYVGKGYGDFKNDLAEVVVGALEPMQQTVQEYMNDPAELDRVLDTGAEHARGIATETLAKVYNAVGLGY